MVSKSTAGQRILAIATPLFAARGFGGVSLREITEKARVNLAAVNYHFYDKEALYVEVLTRCLRRIHGAQLSLLHAAEAASPGELVPLPLAFDALSRPLFSPNDPATTAEARLLGRLLIDRHPFTEPLVQSEFQPAMTRFGQAIRRHVPSLSAADFLWRFSFVVGALHHSLLTFHQMRSLTQGICHDGDAEAALSNFTNFAVAAMTPNADLDPITPRKLCS
jgi:AcrR family transcriptional regulator